MKKIVLCFVLILGCLGILIVATPAKTNTEYLRIHIRANSNLTIDQNIKYQVKDAVVDFMIPLLAQCETLEKSKQMVLPSPSSDAP